MVLQDPSQICPFVVLYRSAYTVIFSHQENECCSQGDIVETDRFNRQVGKKLKFHMLLMLVILNFKGYL